MDFVKRGNNIVIRFMGFPILISLAAALNVFNMNFVGGILKAIRIDIVIDKTHNCRRALI